MIVYIGTKSHENILGGINLYSGHNFIAKISKGHNSVKNADRFTVLFLCRSSDRGLHFYKFHENILDGIKVIERTRFSSENFQRAIIP